MRRVVVTGLGIVSCIGNNKDEVLKSLLNTKSGIVFSEEYKKYNSKITLAEVKKALKIRDYSDINRKHSPLRVSKDSIVIDSSKINKKQMLTKLSKIVEKKLKEKYGRNL